MPSDSELRYPASGLVDCECVCGGVCIHSPRWSIAEVLDELECACMTGLNQTVTGRGKATVRGSVELQKARH